MAHEGQGCTDLEHFFGLLQHLLELSHEFRKPATGCKLHRAASDNKHTANLFEMTVIRYSFSLLMRHGAAKTTRTRTSLCTARVSSRAACPCHTAPHPYLTTHDPGFVAVVYNDKFGYAANERCEMSKLRRHRAHRKESTDDVDERRVEWT